MLQTKSGLNLKKPHKILCGNKNKILSGEVMKKLPLYYCKCCKKCRYRNKEMKSLFDDKYLVNCADINGIGTTPIIPNLLYVIDWCKVRKE